MGKKKKRFLERVKEELASIAIAIALMALSSDLFPFYYGAWVKGP